MIFKNLSKAALFVAAAAIYNNAQADMFTFCNSATGSAVGWNGGPTSTALSCATEKYAFKNPEFTKAFKKKWCSGTIRPDLTTQCQIIDSAFAGIETGQTTDAKYRAKKAVSQAATVAGKVAYNVGSAAVTGAKKVAVATGNAMAYGARVVSQPFVSSGNDVANSTAGQDVSQGIQGGLDQDVDDVVVTQIVED